MRQVEREVAMVLQMAYLVHDGSSAAAAKGGAAAVPPPLLAGEVNGRPFRPRGPPIKAVVIPAKEFVQVRAQGDGRVSYCFPAATALSTCYESCVAPCWTSTGVVSVEGHDFSRVG